MNSIIFKKEDTDNIAVVVVGYNRIKCLQRLIESLLKAEYRSYSVPLFISIDASGVEELYNYVKSIEWPFGNKYINIEKERLGLKKHILQCGDLTAHFKAVVILEDDIYVSPYYFDYVVAAVEKYGNNDKIGGIALYEREMDYMNYPYLPIHDGSDAYLRQATASWGECWTLHQWNGFRKWMANFQDAKFSDIDMPTFMKKWERAWSKYYMAYLIETNRYFVFPYVSLTTCFGDAGEHSDSMSTLGQVNLLSGEKKYIFHDAEEMTKYDIYGTNEVIYEKVGLSKEELCVDWHGYNENIRGCKYLLTCRKLSCKVVKEFGLLMRPIELNVLNDIGGEGIYIYDTENGKTNDGKGKLTSRAASYYLKEINPDVTLQYVKLKAEGFLRRMLKRIK